MRKIGRGIGLAAAAAGIGLLATACVSSDGSGSPAGPSASSAATGAAGSGSTAVPSAATSGSAAASSSAKGSSEVDLQPSTAAPGSTVMVYGLSCSASTGTATSPAFTAPVPLSMLSNATGGSATVKSGLAAGSYPVTVTCGSVTVTGSLTVS